MTELADETCVPCRGGTPRLTGTEMTEGLALIPGWTAVDGGTVLSREWKCRNYRQALAMVTAASAVAEAAGHHPDVAFGWGYARMSLTTHAIGGLSRNDLVMAARIDVALAGLPHA